MIAEQAEHDQAAADAAAAEFEAQDSKKRPAPKTFTRSDDETPVEGVEEATSKCFRCGDSDCWCFGIEQRRQSHQLTSERSLRDVDAVDRLG